MSRLSRIVRKSMYWHGHGKHSTIPPHLRPELRRQPINTEWFASMQEAFASIRRQGKRKP